MPLNLLSTDPTHQSTNLRFSAVKAARAAPHSMNSVQNLQHFDAFRQQSTLNTQKLGLSAFIGS
jgi:hypothetical protein